MPTISFNIVKQFEEEVAKFAGAKFGVAMDSCSNALFLCCYYLKVKTISIPKHTYFSVPCSIIHAGGSVVFDNRKWNGCYRLKPYPIYDSALRFCKNMYIQDSFYCLSFHAKKILNIGRGGMILCDDEDAAQWFRKARMDGRNDVAMQDDNITMLGWNIYMTPEQAARGLHLLELLKSKKEIPNIHQDYPDLSKFRVYTQ